MYNGPISPTLGLAHLGFRYPLAVVALLTGAVLVWPDTNPSRMVSVTFDDAAISQYQLAYPIFKENDLRGSLYVITDRITGYPGFMNADQILELHQAGWEIGSHSASHPHLTQIDNQQLTQELAESSSAIANVTGEVPVTFASPYGDFNQTVIDAISEHYIAHLRAWGGNEGANDITAINPFDIGRFELESYHTSADICEMIQNLGEKTWFVLNVHRVVDVNPEEFDTTAETLTGIAECLKAEQDAGRIEVKPVNEVLEMFAPVEESF